MNLPYKAFTLSDLGDLMDLQVDGKGQPISLDNAKQYVPLVRRAQGKRAGAVRNVPFSIMSGENDVTDKPRFRDIPGLVYKAELSLSAYGAAYWGKEENRIRETWSVWYAPKTIKLKVVDGRWVGFTRTFNGVERPIAKEDMVYFWEPDEDIEVGPGQSALSTVLYAASTLHDADRTVDSYYKRGGIRVTIFAVPQATREEEIKNLKSWWTRTGTTIRNAYNTVFYRGKKLDPTVVGDMLKDMWSSDFTEDKREDIADAFGIPSSMLLSNSANYATAHEDSVGWHYDFVFPRCAWIADTVNRLWLADEGLEMVYHPEMTEIWQSAQLSQGEEVTRLYEAGIMELDEARMAVALPEIDSKDATTPEADENDDEPAQKAALQSDIDKWERYAAKRYREGHPEKALTFKSNEIPETLQAAIRGGLGEAQDAQAVTRIFNDAGLWRDYGFFRA